MASWDEFKEAFAEALEIEGNDFTLDTALEEIEEWDSIGALSLIASVDDEFDTILNPDDLEKCVTVGDIFKLN